MENKKIEKNIAKKPGVFKYSIGKTFELYDGYYETVYCCPECRMPIPDDTEKCERCGQIIDWD